MVQFMKVIIEEASLKAFEMLWANARERRMCDVGQKWDRTNSSRVYVNARFRLHLRSPAAACRRPSGTIRTSAPLPSVAARAVRSQANLKISSR